MKAAKTAAAGSLGVYGSVAILALIEAGVPIPIPGDLLMILIGERAAAGAIPVWLGVALLELAVAFGISTLFLMVRGPGRAILDRAGPRVGLTPERIQRATARFESKGRPALAVGRATPGLRTLSVLAAGSSSMAPVPALLALMAGGTVFVQAHFVLGYLLGPLAREFIETAIGYLPLVAAGLLALGVVVWIIRRGLRSGTQAWTEAACPACLLVEIISREPSAGPQDATT